MHEKHYCIYHNKFMGWNPCLQNRNGSTGSTGNGHCSCLGIIKKQFDWSNSVKNRPITGLKTGQESATYIKLFFFI